MTRQKRSGTNFPKMYSILISALILAGAWTLEAHSVPPNVVVIVMDTVRQDHLSCYGYERETTPFLEELARSGRLYRNAYSTSSWTVPAHASLFTGLHPVSHGMHWEHLHLSEELVTLPEVLKEFGYMTLGFTENSWISESKGFGQGFDSLKYDRSKLKSSKMRNKSFLGFKKSLEEIGDKPFFVFINLVSAHAPYRSSGQFFKMFLSDPAYEKEVKVDFLAPRAKGTGFPSKKALTHLTEHYDAEIRYVDHIIEAIAEELQRKGLWERTLFIVTSDHGESLGEHEHLEHQFYLYEHLVRIPLIIRYPKLFPPGSHDDNPVSLTDVFPTVLRVLEIDPKQFSIQGHSLLPGETMPERSILCEYYVHPGFTDAKKYSREEYKHPRIREQLMRRLKSIRVGDFKWVQGSNGTKELYDIAKDPGETRNLAEHSDFSVTAEKLRIILGDRLEQYRSQISPGFESNPLDAKTIETMKSLGYL